MKLDRIAVFVAAVALTFATQADIASATQISVEEDGKRKINISGRQRMLSQRMAKAACFASIGVDRTAHVQMATKAHEEFGVALVGLREGSAELGLLPENAPVILTELDAVDDIWAAYGPAVASLLEGETVSSEGMANVAKLSLPTLVQMNRAVGEFEKRYGGSNIHPSLALAINVSGRQRMLSQKSSKEFCLIMAGENPDANREVLAETIALFEASLAALMDGDQTLGLPEAPTDEIYEQLDKVQVLWTPMADILKSVARGSSASDAEIAFVAERNNEVLVEMNKAVGMYANL
ncbi:MAG: type IV pili methyl-accepting chemotaxis transducer N-terminal domain-containing protein [Pseudomonadota bacterium]